MRKILSIFTIFCVTFTNFFSFLPAFASGNIVVNEFWVQINWGTRYQGTTYAEPGNTVRTQVVWINSGDELTNVSLEYGFSSSDFTYMSPETIDTKKNGVNVNENVSLSEFNPPTDTILPIAPTASPGDTLEASFLLLKLNQTFSQPLFTMSTKFIADGYNGGSLTRDVYVNVRPHILDFYFEKSGNTLTSQVQGSNAEPIDFVMKVKDANGCNNIDGGIVKADLSQIGAQAQEVLSFVSCEADGKTAIFKKTGITTDAALGSYSFDPSTFQIVDEDGNSFLLNDPNTSFDDVDKKTSITLSVVAAAAPSVSLNSVDSYFVWGPEKLSATLNLSANQNGEYKSIVWTDGTCASGTIIQDWTGTGVMASTPFLVTIPASFLQLWANNIQVCVKNTWGNIGSYSVNITKDTTAPTLSNLTVWPANIIANDVNVSFVCSENGSYQVRLGGTGTWDGTLISSGSVLAWQPKWTTLTNSNFVLGNNPFYVYCRDEASNYVASVANVKKVPPTPNMSSVNMLQDLDFDYQGIDGRDLSITWNNTAAVWYDDFESYRIYVIPSNISFDPNTHTPIKILSTKNDTSFTGDKNILVDSTSTSFVAWGSYQACIAILWTNGMLGGASCSGPAVITSDTVLNAKILSAKFTSPTILELTTDTTLDTNLAAHSGSLVSFMANGNPSTAVWVSSISGTKISFTIPNLANPAATGNSLVVQTGAIRSSVWGFNNYFSSGALQINDGQAPVISALTVTTPSVYSNYYSGTLNVSYTLSETMNSAGLTKIIFERFAGNSSSNKEFLITDVSKLSAGNKNINIDLAQIGLVNGAFYTVKMEGRDGGNNYTSTTATTVKYDASAPDTVVLIAQNDTSNPTPTLSWNVPSDNGGNGSGIESYTVSLFNNLTCASTAIQTSVVTSPSFTPTTLSNGNYSFLVTAKDRMGNVSSASSCETFEVDTTIPTISQLTLQDQVIPSTLYTKSGNQITLTAVLSNTNSTKIVADLSLLTGNASHTWVVCSSPVSGVSCSYVAPNVTYTFDVGFAGTVTQALRQVRLYVSTPSDVTTVNAQTSITVDNTSPSIGVISTPTASTYWGNTLNIVYSGISDSNLAYLRYEYSTNSGSSWNVIATGSNVGSYNWNISALSSGAQYKVRILAYDASGNVSTTTSSVFSLDKTPPVIAGNIFTSPTSGQFVKGNVSFPITWNAAWVTDSNGLKVNPIALSYSTDNQATWISLSNTLPNSGTYTWNIPAINAANVYLKMVVTDDVGNTSEQVSSFSFTVDSAKPNIDISLGTPPNASFINNGWFEIFGSSSDTNLKQVGYYLERKTDGKFWNGTTFITGSYLNVLQDNIEGTIYNFSQMIAVWGITHTTQYDFTLESTDKSGNKTTTTPRDYTWDTSMPWLSITTASGSYFASDITLAGTSSDNLSGISSVKIAIEKNGEYWNGSTYVPTQQLLSVQTANNYANWTYAFTPDNSDVHGQNYTVSVYAYDTSYKTANETQQNITIQKDSQSPTIGTNVFTFDSEKLYLGWETLSITWNPWDIIDSWAGLKTSPITLEYFDGASWNPIASNLANNGSYDFVLPSLDASNVRVRISATDRVENTSSLNSSTFLVDSTPPEISSVETMDMDANGQIDALLVRMSENILDSSLVLGDFSISWVGAPTGVQTGGFGDDEVFILTFANTGNTATKPTLSYVKGTLRDIAGKRLENVTSFASTDTAIPRILTLEAQDMNENGKIERISLTVSENLAASSTLNWFTLHNAFLGMSLNSLNVSGNIILISLQEGTEFDTSVGSLALSLNNSVYADVAGNLLGNISSQPLIDKAAPVLLTAQSLDTNSDAKLDRIELEFSENISGTNYWHFSVNNLAPGAIYAGWGTTLWKKITLTITPTTDAYDTDTLAQISYAGNSVQDTGWNLLANIVSRNSQDTIAPKLLSASTKDENGNGKIDLIVVQYSENLSGTTLWLSSSVSSYGVTGQSIVGSTLKIAVEEKNIFDTSSTPTLSIISNTTLTDLAGNMSALHPWIVSEDTVGPVIIGARYEDGTGKIYLTFSENINLADFTLGNFVLQNAWAYTIGSVNSGELSLTLSAGTINFATSKISFATDSVRDSLGNKQENEFFTSITAPIIINEVMISSTSDNNYIELKNLSNMSVDLSGFEIAWVTIPNGQSIAANGLYLITKSSPATSILNISPDRVDGGLDLSGNTLILTNGVISIDRADVTLGYINTTLPASMERRNPPGNGMDPGSWYQAIVSQGFDTSVPLGTPKSPNIEDNTPPSFVSSIPAINQLLPVSSFDLEVEFEENMGWVGVDTTSIDFELFKYNGVSWGSDIASTYVNFSWSTLSQTQAIYPVENLPYGKYKAVVSVADRAGNILNQEIVFYVDKFEVTLNQTSFDIGTLDALAPKYGSWEVVVTIKTLWAGFNITSIVPEMTSWLENIIHFNGSRGWGADINAENNGYSAGLTNMSWASIVSKSQNINGDGEQHTYTYKLKYGAHAVWDEAAGLYQAQTNFLIEAQY